jgi:hypothetical protein
MTETRFESAESAWARSLRAREHHACLGDNRSGAGQRDVVGGHARTRRRAAAANCYFGECDAQVGDWVRLRLLSNEPPKGPTRNCAAGT